MLRQKDDFGSINSMNINLPIKLFSSMAPKIIMLIVFNIFLFSALLPANAQTWIRAGYWYKGTGFDSSKINSALFTHLLCAFADMNSTTYKLSIPLSDENQFSTFTDNVKQKNPSIITILSIGGGGATDSTSFPSMAGNSSYRKSFIDSSMKTARLYGFQGLDLAWVPGKSISDMTNMGTLFQDWRTAIGLEANNSSMPQLILTARVDYSPTGIRPGNYPTQSMQQYLDWVHVQASDYSRPEWSNFTGAHAALYNPHSILSADYGIKTWINGGLSANKLVLCLPYYGYAWTLVNPEDNGIGAPAKGPAITKPDGFMRYYSIKNRIKENGASVQVMYDAAYVVNYCTIGTAWIGFDDVEVVKIKVSYAKEKGLRGYYAWEVPYDDNWVLSEVATLQEGTGNENGRNNRRLVVIVLSTTSAVILLIAFVVYYCWRRKHKLKGKIDAAKQSKDKSKKATADGDFNSNVPDLLEYTLADIEAATNQFENKLGEGGYGPVYKGILANGQEIAVKKLSKTSAQGFEEFKNEVMLTAKLQHVNLVRVLGFCIDKEEQILIYEYMPKKSLDYYLFDPIRRFVLDWRKRLHIIEGVTQGLLYLQEYSRLTIIHRDIKASNVLLDINMKPKISDFGMAKIFVKDNLEANTKRIVGTYGYVPPEYVRRGIYSTKYDVYSFGVVLLQIISGKRVSSLYGPNQNLGLLEYAYELWKLDGKGMEFMDPSLDDANSSCKLTRCLQIALLCVQESPNDRPSMLEVSSMLKNEITDIMIPKKPAFSIQNDVQRHNSTPQIEICSGNDLTFSEELAR